MKKNRIIFCIIFTLIMSITSLNIALAKEVLTKTAFGMDTIINVSLYDYEGKNDAINALDEMQDFLHKYELIFSATNKNSELYKLNHNEIELKDTSKDLQYVIASASEIAALSDGTFDINQRKSIELWDVLHRKKAPTKEEILRAKKDKTQIDLGAIAKGYVSDKLKEYFIDNSVKSAILTVGSNVVCIGKKGNRDFNIGIEFPFQEDKLIDAVQVSNTAVVTSGIYVRYFKENDKIYSHIIDPKTGCPVDNELYSVSIISDNSMLADAVSTACMVLGYEKSKPFLKKVKQIYDKDLKAVFVNNKCKVVKYD